MENKYNVTIPLEKYDELIVNNIRYRDILQEFTKIIINTDRLSWNKEELNIPECILPTIKKLLSLEYNHKLNSLKKELVDKDDKQE